VSTPGAGRHPRLSDSSPSCPCPFSFPEVLCFLAGPWLPAPSPLGPTLFPPFPVLSLPPPPLVRPKAQIRPGYEGMPGLQPARAPLLRPQQKALRARRPEAATAPAPDGTPSRPASDPSAPPPLPPHTLPPRLLTLPPSSLPCPSLGTGADPLRHPPVAAGSHFGKPRPGALTWGQAGRGGASQARYWYQKDPARCCALCSALLRLGCARGCPAPCLSLPPPLPPGPTPSTPGSALPLLPPPPCPCFCALLLGFKRRPQHRPAPPGAEPLESAPPPVGSVLVALLLVQGAQSPAAPPCPCPCPSVAASALLTRSQPRSVNRRASRQSSPLACLGCTRAGPHLLRPLPSGLSAEPSVLALPLPGALGPWKTCSGGSFPGGAGGRKPADLGSVRPRAPGTL